MTTARFPIVPASFFGMVLGVAGLASAWREATLAWGLPAQVGEALSLLGAALWLVLMLMYLSKWFARRAEARAEFDHPVLCCFVGIIPLTTALVGASTVRYFGVVSQGFPQLVRVSSDVVRPDNSKVFAERMPVICQVRMLNEAPLVPDIERLEEMIAEETRAA